MANASEGVWPTLPFEIPGVGREGIPVNPYPDRPDCADEWAAAYKFCASKQKEFKPGYSGWGADFGKCVLGQVSAACGGNSYEA
jgi:hypothetical protein